MSSFLAEATRRRWITEVQAAAAARFADERAAERARYAASRLGPLAEVVEWVCCEDRKPSEWALKTGRRPEDGMVILKLGLDVLAQHYGIAADD